MRKRTHGQDDHMMSLGDLARLLGIPGDFSPRRFERVCTDSRTLRPGDLFVALRGDNFDGHAFVPDAMERGAVGALVEVQARGVEARRIIQVSSTREALSLLANAWRRKISPKLVAVTGSNGKTTVKEMLASILRQTAVRQNLDPDLSVLATEGNLNNTLGVPLTLLRLRSTHRWAVIEMGMNSVGEISAMSRVAQPDVALINNVQRAHVGLLGGLEQVARAKAEIFEGLAPSGVALIPANDPMAPLLEELAAGHAVRKFSLGDDKREVHGRFRGNEFLIGDARREFPVRLPVPGQHNHANAVAAAAAALAIDVDPEDVRQGLEAFAGVPGRLQYKAAASGALVIDDTYNANPDSVLAAVQVLAALPGKRILVLGDLGELGRFSGELHVEVGHRAKNAGIDTCLALGEWTRKTCEAFGAGAVHFDDREALIESLRAELGPGVTVLVKGSRFMAMEKVVEGLLQ